ncbi:MAG: hypothetical protein MK212_18710 [Saprospiraceae bacterium]|nr:hypothetical protein [Saprospiraceae bacterium]
MESFINYPLKDSTEPFNLLVKGGHSYLGVPILSLLEYNKESETYIFEDDYVFFEDPTTPSSKAHLFVEIKSKHQLADLEFYTDVDLKKERTTTINYLHFRCICPDLKFSFDGYIISKEYVKKHGLEEIGEVNELLFIKNYGVIVEEITFNNVYSLAKKIQSLSIRDKHRFFLV